jgi:hypothetical protein
MPAARALTPSQSDWLRVRSYLQEHRHDLAVAAAAGYPAGRRVAGTPLLAAPGWRPAGPVPLQDLELEFSPQPAPARPEIPAALLPERPDGTRYPSYSAALGDLAAPAVFENRPTYRLTQADLPRLAFTRGRYFDGIDTGEAAAHEFAASRLGARDPRGAAGLRARIADPCDLRRRPANLAISTLTLRLDAAAGRASFLLHWRDPAKVGHAGGMYQVVPVGVFQPSGDAPWHERQDFSLWRCMLREFDEELRGRSEDYGSGPVDYDAWPFARHMTAALDRGQIRVWCLGLGADPLTYATDLLTVAVIDSAVYDEFFSLAPRGNAEGRVLAAREFAAHVIDRIVTGEPVQAAGAALLRLAWRHRDVLTGLPVLVTGSRLLEYQLGLGHPFLAPAHAHVDERHDRDRHDGEEHQQAPEDRAAAGERREVGLPDHDDAGRRRDHRHDHVQQRVELGAALGQVVLHHPDDVPVPAGHVGGRLLDGPHARAAAAPRRVGQVELEERRAGVRPPPGVHHVGQDGDHAARPGPGGCLLHDQVRVDAPLPGLRHLGVAERVPEPAHAHAAVEADARDTRMPRRLPGRNAGGFGPTCFTGWRETVVGTENLNDGRHVVQFYGHDSPKPGAPGAVRTFAFARDAPALARRFAVATLRGWGAGDVADDAALVVTELAANAIQHAHTAFTVILSARADLLRISVRDASPLHGALRPAPLHGLGAVDAMASRWGVESLGSAGKTVWVDLHR